MDLKQKRGHDVKTAWKETLKSILFDKEPNAKRSIYLDYLRVIAAVFVICVHTVSLAATMVVPGSVSFQVLEILNFSFLSCNLLFIMISGALLLPVKQEKISAFFTRRFSKVAIPMVIYYILYVCAKEGISQIYPANWGTLLKRILSGAPHEAPHFWLVYVILMLYILTPPLRFLIQKIPDDILRGLILVIFLVNAIDTYTPIWGIEAHLSVVVDSFAGVFILGYFLAGKCTKGEADFLILGGIISFLVSCILIVNTETYAQYIFQNAPTMLLFSSALFLLVKRGTFRLTRESLFVRLIGRYSFSILLIHWGVLHYVVKQMLGVNVLSGGIVGGCLLMIALTLIISVIGAVILEHTLIRLVHALFSKGSTIIRYLFPVG